MELAKLFCKCDFVYFLTFWRFLGSLKCKNLKVRKLGGSFETFVSIFYPHLGHMDHLLLRHWNRHLHRLLHMLMMMTLASFIWKDYESCFKDCTDCIPFPLKSFQPLRTVRLPEAIASLGLSHRDVHNLLHHLWDWNIHLGKHWPLTEQSHVGVRSKCFKLDKIQLTSPVPLLTSLPLGKFSMFLRGIDPQKDMFATLSTMKTSNVTNLG